MHCGACAQVSTLLLVPICPHSCEHVWRDVLRRPGSALTAGFPAPSAPPNFALKAAAEYLVEEVAVLRKGIEKAEAPPKKKGNPAQPPPPKVPLHLALFVVWGLSNVDCVLCWNVCVHCLAAANVVKQAHLVGAHTCRVFDSSARFCYVNHVAKLRKLDISMGLYSWHKATLVASRCLCCSGWRVSAFAAW